jgi:hypothetical protein
MSEGIVKWMRDFAAKHYNEDRCAMATKAADRIESLEAEKQQLIDTCLQLGVDRWRFLFVLRSIAKYQTAEEMTRAQESKADFVAGYGNIIRYARQQIDGVEAE